MGPFDAVMAAGRTSGFEPRIDQHGAGSTVWGYIAAGRGVGRVVSSLIEQLPSGVALIDVGLHGRCSPSTACGDATSSCPRSRTSSRVRKASSGNAIGRRSTRQLCATRRQLPASL